MKAETQTHKDSKSKKFAFPRGSFTNESFSQNTEPLISKQLVFIMLLDSQIDAHSSAQQEDMVFENS